jgi:DNA-binding NarL/FixJ family response regulator
MRVLSADDQEFMRRGVRAVLSEKREVRLFQLIEPRRHRSAAASKNEASFVGQTSVQGS